MRYLVAMLTAVALFAVGTETTSAQNICKRWDKCSIYQKHEFIHWRQTKALSVIDFFLAHPKIRKTAQGKKVMHKWRVIYSRTIRNMERLHDAIYLANSCYGTQSCGGYSIRRSIVKEEVCRYDWQGTPCDGSYSAMNVSYCETAGSFLADPGDDPGNPYMGLFELGPSERQQYGRGIYASPYYDTAKYSGVVDMVWSAHNLFVGEGRGWGPWSCKPDGSHL